MKMTQLSAAKKKALKLKGLYHGTRTSVPIDVRHRIEKMVQNGLRNFEIAAILIDDGTWPVPKNQKGAWSAQTQPRYWMTAEKNWHRLMRARVKNALRSNQVDKELAENKFRYELSLKPEGERCAWMPEYEPVTRGSNLPSLFTENLQPAFDLKTTATPGTWNLSQWAWDAEQDTQ